MYKRFVLKISGSHKLSALKIGKIGLNGEKAREAIRIEMGMYKDFGQNIYPCQ